MGGAERGEPTGARARGTAATAAAGSRFQRREGELVFVEAAPAGAGGFDLVTAATRSAQGQRLNEPFALVESDVLAFKLDARGLSMLFGADGDTDGVLELFSSFLTRPHLPR